MRLFGRLVIVGWNGERTLRFGVHHEFGPLHRRGFTAIGVWPLLIGIERRRRMP